MSTKLSKRKARSNLAPGVHLHRTLCPELRGPRPVSSHTEHAIDFHVPLESAALEALLSQTDAVVLHERRSTRRHLAAAADSLAFFYADFNVPVLNTPPNNRSLASRLRRIEDIASWRASLHELGPEFTETLLQRLRTFGLKRSLLRKRLSAYKWQTDLLI